MKDKFEFGVITKHVKYNNRFLLGYQEYYLKISLLNFLALVNIFPNSLRNK